MHGKLLRKSELFGKRWTIFKMDYRYPKIIKAVEERAKLGKKTFVVKLDKGKLPTMKEALIDEISRIIDEIKDIQQKNKIDTMYGVNTFIEGSALYHLSLHENDIISAVISSPPHIVTDMIILELMLWN